MEMVAKICPKCGAKGLVPITDIYCFCGTEKVTFPVTEQQYIDMSDEEIESMIQKMGINPKIPLEDARIIYRTTYLPELIDAMIELKEKDIIEYGLKMAHFRTEFEQQNIAKKMNFENRTSAKCPKCGSTDIQAVSAGYSLLYGYTSFGENRNYCKRCGHKWTPRG